VFESVHPILGSQDLRRSIDFYVKKLGFELAFQDSRDDPNYIGLRHGDVLLHMQFQYDYEMSRTRLRIKVSDPDGVHKEYSDLGVEITEAGIRDTDWRTREFSLWDPDHNALAFFQDLSALTR
jgi:catechol 2,3-dioxygenase-like lactoylglutathione lyase family enzyme